ncbi:MAG TPA: DegV family protein [Oscillospiraceae bacterium]|nr:DegV family protein [Oscillospiraceae bacterium]
MEYKLVVNSSCELTEELKNGTETALVPFTLMLGERCFRDDETLDVHDFVSEMKAFPDAARSGCPSPDDYLRAFEGEKAVFGITISSALSGSYAAATAACSLLGKAAERVHIFDSKSASAGEILVAYKIREAVERGLSRAQVIETVTAYIDTMKTLFVLEDTDNLVKNGRMSRLLGKAATALRLCPILGSDDGKIVSCGHARGTAQAISKLASLIGTYCRDTRGRILVITHCENEAAALRLRRLAEDLYQFKQIVVQRTGGLSSLYANRGGIIAAF